MILRFIILLTISFSLYGDILSLDKKITFQEVLSKSKIYIDKTRSLTIDDVLKKQVDFKQNHKDLLGFGYSPNFDVWIELKVANDTDRTIKRIIEFANPLTTNITFYYSKGNYIEDGLFNITNSRKTLNPIFNIELEPNDERTYYIKTSSYITTLIIKLNLWNSDDFYTKEIKHQIILALFFGAMAVLALYNLFIFFFTKDISYFYYVLYIFGIILHQLLYVGFAGLYIFENETLKTVFANASFIVAFPAIALGLFTKSFLQTVQYPKFNKGLIFLLFAVPIVIVLFQAIDGFNKYRNLLTITLFLYLVLISIYAALKRNKQAYYILFGWMVVLIATVLMYLSSTGIFDIYQYYKYVIETAFISEAVIFSIALAERIKELQKEKDDINRKLISQQKEEKDRLKIQVAEKTKDLKEALDEKGLLLKELHHRVKNNMQMIISLIRLQADEINDKKILDIFTTIQNRINAMSHLHELLYKQDNISHINAYEYFDKMIDELKDSYENENIKIVLDIGSELKMEQAIYCGLILNELVTNSFKYGFSEEGGTITIILKKLDKKYNLCICDDGQGYNQDEDKNSLGLLLVDTLVHKQLKGDIDIKTDDGVRVNIVWSDND